MVDSAMLELYDHGKSADHYRLDEASFQFVAAMFGMRVDFPSRVLAAPSVSHLERPLEGLAQQRLENGIVDQYRTCGRGDDYARVPPYDHMGGSQGEGGEDCLSAFVGWVMAIFWGVMVLRAMSG